MSGANVSPIGRNKEEWLVQATDYRKLNEPPRPRLQRNGTIYLMARPPLLCQGGDFAFPAGCPRRPCPADDLWANLGREFLLRATFRNSPSLAFQELQRSLPRELRCFRIVAVTRIVEERVIGLGVDVVLKRLACLRQPPQQNPTEEMSVGSTLGCFSRNSKVDFRSSITP